MYLESFLEGAYSFDLNAAIGKHLFDIYPSSNEENSSMYKVIRTKEPVLNYLTTWETFKGDTHSGVVDTLPIFEDGEIVGAIEIAKFNGKLEEKNAIRLKKKVNLKDSKETYSLDDIITSDEKMQKLKQQIKRVAKTELHILIHGETGTGKEVVAQAVHSSSHRRRKPFISQNCAAIPENLLESILFGTEKGGFTGAENKLGLFQLANGGTLFLDEINSMDFNSQGKILKAIEEKKVMPIGGQEYKNIDVRIICASNEEPMEAVKKQRMRADLFYRISSIILEIPPLSERKRDIRLLTEFFLEQYKNDFDGQEKKISSEVIKVLENYSWPGNVRELKNIIEGAFYMTEGDTIQLHDLPERIGVDSQAEIFIKEKKGLEMALVQFEKAYIEKMAKECKNKTEVASKLGITKQALNYKVKKLDLRINE